MILGCYIYPSISHSLTPGRAYTERSLLVVDRGTALAACVRMRVRVCARMMRRGENHFPDLLPSTSGNSKTGNDMRNLR